MEICFRKRRRHTEFIFASYLISLALQQSDSFSIQRTSFHTPTQLPYLVKTRSVIVPFVPDTYSVSRTSSFILKSTKSSKNRGDEEDIPEDWSEDDVLAEFDDDVVVGDVDVEVEESDDVVVLEEEESVVVATEEDDDDDELDLDEIDLDDEDEEEIDEEVLIEEETIGKYEVEEGWERSLGTKLLEGDAIPWDAEVDGVHYELQDDTSDPNYMAQKSLVEQAIETSNQRLSDESFDAYEFMENYDFSDAEQKAFDASDLLKAFEEKARGMVLEEKDLEGMDLEREYDNASDLMLDDPYPRHAVSEMNILENLSGTTDDDMELLDKTYKNIQRELEEEPWDKVMVASMNGFSGLSNETLAEMDDCLDEIGGSAYNVTNWLLYDLNFNVSNLILAAVKHNPDAPILFQHWYPQLATYKRYQHARDRDFDFSWEDVENADTQELERYYMGFGYEQIPKKAPSETGIISLEDLDEEEIKMAAFENWMTDVYNPEGDRKDFDDDTLRDEDNVFSDYYEAPQHPDLPVFDDVVDDINGWKEELGEDANSDDPEVVNYQNMMGRSFDYKMIKDEQFEKEFRGHLVIACTGDDSDLEIAERITVRFEKEFGKQVYVETRVMALAREEDNIFEIWLESYEVDLLHSKKRATLNTKDWDGPAEVDDDHIEYLTERVSFLISDDARYSYRLDFQYAD